MTIDYQLLIDEAMLSIVRKILIYTKNHGISADRGFYISFVTNHPEVILSKHVRSRYPEEITIALHYEYRDLEVFDDRFAVELSFDNIAERIDVPFSALTGFADPSANFSLQFRYYPYDPFLIDVAHSAELAYMKPKEQSTKKSIAKHAGEVIQIDKFRKKPKS